MATIKRCNPAYLMNAIVARLVSQNVLQGQGMIVGASHQMLSAETQEPFQMLLCPITLMPDKQNEADGFGSITEGTFHIYYRHRNMDDPAYADQIWLNGDTGYYETQARAYRALVPFWPVGTLADAKNGYLLTTGPLKVGMWNEPRRRKWADRSLGEGMFEIRARFILEVDTVDPLA